MKTIHHLKARWLLTAMLAAVLVGELITWFVTQQFGWRFPAVAVAAVSVGLVAAVVSCIYDGRE